MGKPRKPTTVAAVLVIVPVTLFGVWSVFIESYSAGYDAQYVGSGTS